MHESLPHRFAALLLVLASAARAQATDDFAKRVSAPPSDIVSGRVVLPALDETAVISPVAIRAVDPARAADGTLAFETAVEVDADGALALALLSPDAVDWTWRIVDPRGVEVDLAGAAARREIVDALDEPAGWSADRVDVERATAGTWRVRATANGIARTAPPPSGWLVVRTAGRAALLARASTLETRSDVDVAIVARLVDAEPIARTAATARVELATGVVELAMKDDGRHGDGAPGDGLYGALLPRRTSGPVRARVELAATTSSGAVVARTAHVAFPVIERRVALTGAVDARVEGEHAVRIDLEALPLGPAAKLHVSAEIWGVSARGELVPVCWMSSMDTPRERDGALELALHLDTRWIDLAGARAPFSLRRVRVQDPDTGVPHELVDELALSLPAVAPTATTTVTASMLQSLAATPAGPGTSVARSPVAPALVLVHGYCSGGSIWPAAHFTQPKLEFLDPNANRTHDQFALLLRQATSAQSSFGVVAHSQGGMAALHLLTYYASGLDHATGPRLIQSVGSPYQGTPLASLGGFSCGVNANMTPSGSATWLAGIPSWARANVFFWTTQNSGAVCNGLTNLFLQSPNDGTTEMVRGQLPGAVSMGHVSGWCHTTGMSNPAQYTDAARNAERNAQAAR